MDIEGTRLDVSLHESQICFLDEHGDSARGHIVEHIGSDPVLQIQEHIVDVANIIPQEAVQMEWIGGAVHTTGARTEPHGGVDRTCPVHSP